MYPTSDSPAGQAYGNARGLGAGPSYGHAAQNSAPTCTPDVSEIDIRLRELEGTLEDLRSITAGFGMKLQNVLTPQMAQKTGCTESPRPVVSPMSDRLDKLNSEIRFQYHILRDIFDRIAL